MELYNFNLAILKFWLSLISKYLVMTSRRTEKTLRFYVHFMRISNFSSNLKKFPQIVLAFKGVCIFMVCLWAVL